MDIYFYNVGDCNIDFFGYSESMFQEYFDIIEWIVENNIHVYIFNDMLIALPNNKTEYTGYRDNDTAPHLYKRLKEVKGTPAEIVYTGHR